MRRRIMIALLLFLSLSMLSGCKKEEKEHKGELVYLEMGAQPALFITLETLFSM